MPQHVHSWRRLKANKFQCCHPTCYSKMTLEHLEGKLAECPSCGKHFLVYPPDVKPIDGQITCPDCLTGEYHLTLEGRKALIEDLVVKDIQGAHDHRFKALQDLESKLTTRQLKIEDMERKLASRSNEMDLEFEKQEQEFRRKWAHYQEMCAALKLREKKIAQKLLARREALRIKKEELKAKAAKVEAPKQVKPDKVEGTEFTPEQIGDTMIVQLQKILGGETNESS